MVDKDGKHCVAQCTDLDEFAPRSRKNKQSKKPRRKGTAQKRIQAKKPNRPKKNPRLGINKKCKIVYFKTKGETTKDLTAKLKCSRSSIDAVWLKWRQTEMIEYKQMKGRPVKITKEQIDRVADAIDNNADVARMTFFELVQHFELDVTPKRLADKLKETGIQNRVARRKVLLPEESKQDRVQFVKDHFRLQMNWKRLLFSDEVQVQCDTKGRIFVKRRNGQAFDEDKIVEHLQNRSLKVIISMYNVQ